MHQPDGVIRSFVIGTGIGEFLLLRPSRVVDDTDRLRLQHLTVTVTGTNDSFTDYRCHPQRAVPESTWWTSE